MAYFSALCCKSSVTLVPNCVTSCCTNEPTHFCPYLLRTNIRLRVTLLSSGYPPFWLPETTRATASGSITRYLWSILYERKRTGLLNMRRSLVIAARPATLQSRHQCTEKVPLSLIASSLPLNSTTKQHGLELVNGFA